MKKENKNFARNLKWLRKLNHMTQAKCARHFKVKRSSIGAYEEGRAQPKFDMLIKFSGWFGVTIDEMIKTKITEVNPKPLLPAEGRDKKGIAPSTMKEEEKVILLEKLDNVNNLRTSVRTISLEEVEALKTLIPEGLIIDKRGQIPQGATFYEQSFLFVSPKGKLLIQKFRENI